MSFLDNNGLSYFYNKIKEKFIRSVTAGKDILMPDSAGNVTITNVPTADNLTSPDAQASYDKFIYRTSGGSANLQSGEAQLVYIDGNMDISGRTPENFVFTTNNNLFVTYSASIWKTALNDPASGTYIFSYIAPTSETATSTNWTASGQWQYNATTINPESVGLYITGIINPSVTITYSGTGISGASVVPATLFSILTTSATHAFVYYVPDLQEDPTGVEGWKYNGSIVTLSDYGITASGTPENNDTITISTIIGTPNSTVRVDYTKYNAGTITIPTPTSFSATGFNHFDKNSMYIANATISNGQIVENSGTYVCYCKACEANENGWGAYSSNGAIASIGWCTTLPSLTTSVTIPSGTITESTLSIVPVTENGYVVAVVSNMNDLMMHPVWSHAADDPTELGLPAYVEYVEPSVIALPTVDISDNAIPLSEWGMPALGAVADRLNLDAGTYIQKIGCLAATTSNMNYVVELNVPYDYDDNYIYYELPTPITYSVSTDPIYIVNDWGTEEFIGTTVPVGAQTLYGQNLRDKLRTDVELKKLIFEDTTVASSAFASDSAYIDYPYKASIVKSQVRATMVPEITFDLQDAISGLYAPNCESYDGGIYIYASAVPSNDLTIPTIICWRNSES